MTPFPLYEDRSWKLDVAWAAFHLYIVAIAIWATAEMMMQGDSRYAIVTVIFVCMFGYLARARLQMALKKKRRLQDEQ